MAFKTLKSLDEFVLESIFGFGGRGDYQRWVIVSSLEKEDDKSKITGAEAGRGWERYIS
jgi:hypothetical protein